MREFVARISRETSRPRLRILSCLILRLLRAGACVTRRGGLSLCSGRLFNPAGARNQLAKGQGSKVTLHRVERRQLHVLLFHERPHLRGSMSVMFATRRRNQERLSARRARETKPDLSLHRNTSCISSALLITGAIGLTPRSQLAGCQGSVVLQQRVRGKRLNVTLHILSRSLRRG